MLSERIKLARKASGLSQRALAEQAGVSATAISKYEKGTLTPSSRVLLALARAVGVRVELFFRTVQVELKEVEYRKHSRLPKKALAAIEAEIREQAERLLELESYLSTRPIPAFELPQGLPTQVKALEAIEDVALALRGAWDLGTNPVPVLTDTLEERGILVFHTAALHGAKFDGLACTINETPVVVVGRDWPADRQRFTLAHELGHLVLKDRVAGDLDEEKAANRFAGAFLAPRPKVYKELGNQRSWLEPRELCVLKGAYGLSMQGWIFRARDLGIITRATHRRLIQFLGEHGWRKSEPCANVAAETPLLYEQLVFHALGEDLISEAKAAELLGMPLAEFHARRNMEAPDAAVNQ